MDAIELSSVEDCMDGYVFSLFNCALLQPFFRCGFLCFELEFANLRDETVDDLVNAVISRVLLHTLSGIEITVSDDSLSHTIGNSSLLNELDHLPSFLNLWDMSVGNLLTVAI